MTDTLTRITLVILSINLMFFIGQVAVLDTNPDSGKFYDFKTGMFGQFEATGGNTPGSYVLNISDTTLKLPNGASSIDPDTGGTFTDTFTGLKIWVLDSLGLGYILNLLTAPYNFLMMMGLPGDYTFAIGTLWYALSFMILVAWLFRG